MKTKQTDWRVNKQYGIKILPLFVLALATSAISVAATAQETGSVIRDKFTMLYFAPDQKKSCSDIEYYLDQPTVFSWEDLAGSLLSTSQTLIWQQYVQGEWRFPRTFGELSSHTKLERVTVDLDQDGRDESIVRQWAQYKSQQHNRLSLLERTDLVDPTKAESLLTRETIQTLLDGAAVDVRAGGDFYFFEIFEVRNTPYLVAAATVWPDAERDDRTTVVVQFTEHLKPTLACVLRTNIFSKH